jgi:secreted PhoX family phosphatase
MTRLRRREFISTGVAAAGTLALGPEFWQSLAKPARAGDGPYGPLGPPDALGLRLPEGFTAREIARGGSPVAGTAYAWHIFSDGSATYATADGGWIVVSNSEVPTPFHLPIDPPIGDPGDGGASAIKFSAEGEIASAYRILSGTSTNCAGGPTPWGTWLSCEETDDGRVWECDPYGEQEAVVHDALGRFTHEAICVDRRTGFAYLSEDDGSGCFYRFRPQRQGDLSEGVLEVAAIGKQHRVRWIPVPDPSAAEAPTRDQVPEATRFKRGEGIWFDDGFVYLATTGDSRIWAYDTRKRKMRVIYDGEKLADAPLTDVDNVTIHDPSGDLFVCEDNGAPDAYDIALVTPGGRDHKRRRTVARFMKMTGPQHGDPTTEAASEVTGVAFDPSGRRMYFASQRAFGVGAIYEVTGPFRTRLTRSAG